ncbi:Oidioi.mRNA.OKI2018_I69.XSR.g16868.t1.cds [Oikopleura dioica]|uniref:Oidioi.mRNA.OKI2018_I69.XSR.g16868.t1.cds n=1 Tax=Oikopleura dioica TaxID=34765 RepID=A0ABN7SPR6_OIKDI|nr:Oidioi.mRNA.OKI2018_I69.XSR.g16868.t1.cds [Oikopleura dioica]
MRTSPLLAIFVGSGEADFLDFWRETDIFAHQIRDTIYKKGAQKFSKKYDRVREVVNFYQSSGECDSVVTSPTYEPVTFDEGSFDRRASPATNIAVFTDLIDRWIQSYACIEDLATFDSIVEALSDIFKIAKRKINRDQDVAFHLSEDVMTFDQARAYCFTNDMWLANPKNSGQQWGIKRSEFTNKFVWFDSWKANEGECWYQNSWHKLINNGTGSMAGTNEGPTDCNNKYHAACESGQLYEKTCLTFKKAPYGETEFVDAQAYCNLAGGSLPFFNDKKELDEFNSQVSTRQMIGLVRDSKLASGWMTRTGEEATFFKWRKGEPNNAGGDENCVATASNSDLLWNDVPCGFPDPVDFSCRFDETIHVWNSCPRHVMPARPQCYDPCDGFDNCQTFVDSCPIVPSKDNLIATVEEPTINFEVTVDVWFPYATAVNGQYFQIFRMGTGGREGEFGDRFFGMWLNRGKSKQYQIQMNAVQSLSILPTFYAKQMVSDIDNSEMQRWSTFKYSQSPHETDSTKTTSKLFKDGVLIAEFDQNTADIEIDRSLNVWVGDPWYNAAQEYRVKNFSFKKFPSTPHGNVASIIVSSGEVSGHIQRFDWDGESLSKGRVVGDVGDTRDMTRPLLFPFSMADECGLIETTSDSAGAFTQIDDTYGLEGGWLERIATTFFSDGTQVHLDFRTPPPVDDGNMGRLYAAQLGKVNGQYYVFGGYKAPYAIYSVNGCEMEELPIKLKTQRAVYGPEVRTLVHADGDERAYICFSNSQNGKFSKLSNFRRCDTFDGSEVETSLYKSITNRRDASIASYRDGLLAFGGYSYTKSAEIFTSETGFVPTTDLIVGVKGMTSATIGGDRVFSFGGDVDGLTTGTFNSVINDKIFMYYDGVWSDLGSMVTNNYRMSAIVFEHNLRQIAAADCEDDDPDC